MTELTMTVETKTRGRHRSVAAEASILRSTLELLENTPLRHVTVDEIARRAGVSKATIYKWWPNKSVLALDAYLQSLSESVIMPDTGSAEQDFTEQLQSLLRFYIESPVGRLFCQFVAEGQSDPEFLRLVRERFFNVRRDAVRVMWQRGVDRGEIRPELDSELVLDLVYGPALLRLFIGHASLAPDETCRTIKAIFQGIRQPGWQAG